MKTMISVAVVMMSTAAWSAVTVREAPATGQETNFIREGSFSSGKIGEPPPKPWQFSKSTEKARATVATPAGRPEAERWVRLVDDGEKEPANIRQSFTPVRSGRFQARLILNKDDGRLFFNLGSGAASKPEERAVQLSIDADGSLVARGEQKSKTSLQIKAGQVYLVRCDFEPIKDGKAVRVAAELVEEASQRLSRVETEVDTQMVITAVRVTSTGPDTGVDYCVTDLSLTTVARRPIRNKPSMLSTYDYLVIGFYFAFMAMIGWVCRKFIGNTSDYFRGGGKMLWWMAGCSAFVAQFSAWTFTGAAGKAYQDGPVIMVLYLANALGFFCNYLFFAPRFRQMRVVTSIQAVKARFGNGSEQFFTWVQLPVGVLYAGIWLSGLSVFISAAFGWNLNTTVIVTGSVVLVMAVIGGSWAVAAGDFIQTLVLMPITLVTAFLAIAQVGGWGSFLEKLPRHHLHWSEGARVEILYLWIIAIVIKQFISTNNMLEASRYLNAKDGRQAGKAALLASSLFVVGPVFWFIPPMVARIVHPDLHSVFPNLKNPAEGAFVVAGLDNMPAGMLGLLISGIFGATMSNMDIGLNKNAGFFVKNFYQVVVRPRAHEKEMLLVSKIATFLLGILVITAALAFSKGKVGLFNLMLQFGGLIALPYCIPLIWGTLIKRAPAWAGWTTVVIGLATSLPGKKFLTPEWLQGFMGWSTMPLSGREADDWVLLLGVLLDVVVCSAWFLGTCYFTRLRPAQEVERVEKFFTQMRTPVDFHKEEGAGNDAQQYRTLGIMSLIYGAFISLLVLIPNSPRGRLGMFACAGVMLGVGGLLYWNARRLDAKAREPKSTATKLT